MYPAAAVANAILEKARAEARPVTHMQLQKLVYIAHGWHLAVTGEPLISDPVEAWKYGPVIPALYRQLAGYGGDPVGEPVAWWDRSVEAWSASGPELKPETRDVLDRVWDRYKHLNGLQLSTLTHEKGTPWYKAAGELPAPARRHILIPDRDIRAHYVKLGQRNG